MAERQKALRFPKKFLWGVSIAAHQVEGNNHNQWTAWEAEHAQALAAQAEYQYGMLDGWADVQAAATSPDTYRSGEAARHYELYEKDFDMLKKMRLGALKFSVEWSRIEPEEGVWNAEAINHYKAYVAALKKRGIEPILTLFHFTLPVWFAEKGGFEKRANVRYFVRFAEKIVSELGAPVRLVITMNEPDTYALESYYLGDWPPALHSKRKWLTVTNNLARAHIQAAAAIHALSRRYRVSVAKHASYYYAGDDAQLSQKSASVLQYIHDDFFLRKVVKRCDFLGVNFDASHRVYGYRIHSPEHRVSDTGADLSPADIQFSLERLHEKYQLPILVTENGLADARDDNRQWWLTQTLLGMQRALDAGVILEGYCYRSLMDGFEWDKGTWPRFGLLEVDYTTYRRTPRKSAVWYARIVKKIQEEAA